MRKLFLLLAAGAMAFPFPVQANPPGRIPPSEALAFCTAAEEATPGGFPYGDCVAFLLSSDTGFLTQFCRYLDSEGTLDELGISLSDCIRMNHGQSV